MQCFFALYTDVFLYGVCDKSHQLLYDILFNSVDEVPVELLCKQLDREIVYVNGHVIMPSLLLMHIFLLWLMHDRGSICR